MLLTVNEMADFVKEQIASVSGGNLSVKGSVQLGGSWKKHGFSFGYNSLTADEQPLSQL